MKKLVILSAIAMSGLFANKANAQLSIHLGFHIPGPRVYVPAPPPVVVQDQPVYDDDNAQVNYNDNSDDYYYLPEVEAYYSVPNHCYYYNNGNNWVTCAYLPGAYRNYDWRTAVRYEVRGRQPYLHHDIYRERWGGYQGDRGNWGRRFDRRYDGGYAYQNHDNRGWNRGGWGNDHNRGNWGGRPGDGRNGGNWGGQPNQGGNYNRGNWGGQDHGNQNNGGNHNQGGWGGQNQGGQDHSDRNNGGGQPSRNQDHGNRGGGQSFAGNRGGFGVRQ
ncbi:hypothetical protein [Mucilaginibacter dorajii]|nr:hypothetical protein [Mucilaginibacter dorajii]MCS3736189.1 hypothetical protein [Mucilaginibacter dorajii]